MKLLTLLIFLIPIYSITNCVAQGKNYFTELNPQKHNTTIVLNLKKKQDRGFFSELGQIDPYRLDDKPIIAPPPNSIDTTDALRTVITVNIDKPSLLTIGFSEFYVLPGDSLNIDFEVLNRTKTEYEDVIHVNTGNVFFTRYNGQPKQEIRAFQKGLGDSLNSLKKPDEFNRYLSERNINSIADSYVQLLFNQFSNLKADSNTHNNIKNYSINGIYQSLFANLSIIYKKYYNDNELKACLENNVSKMIAAYNMQKPLLSAPNYWLGWSAAYFFYKEKKYDFNSILEKFKNCDAIIRQYIMLKCLKDGIPYNGKTHINDLSAMFTYPPFKSASYRYLTDPNLGNGISQNLNMVIRNAEIYDANGNKIHFYEVFKNTEQPYILFDFCGTWCVPCLDEISIYSKNRHLDNSKKVRPVWLFFENDMTKWKGVVAQYHLDEKSCFLVLGKEFMNEFAKSFDWAEEFPHHFLFSKDGKIIQSKASSLTEFDESKL
jgi:hypothetical protein